MTTAAPPPPHACPEATCQGDPAGRLEPVDDEAFDDFDENDFCSECGDGVPLVGVTRSKNVAVAAGHGMRGITLGPITGRLLARSLMTGVPVPEFAGLDPLR